MYDDLVKRLRRCEQFKCRECEYEKVNGCRTKLNEEAADAIEELSEYINTMRRLKCDGWHLQQTKFHDGYQAVATMPLPEPPKEKS